MMQWSKLLSEKRVGQLRGKTESAKDARTAFERDYGRVVFSTPLRRLQDKTQVFPLEQHDAVRTRLTHSLEVSSVSRTLGHEVGNWIAQKNEINSRQVHDIETISATCGLLHDLGNPPFGHAGEDAIRSWFSDRLRHEEIARQHDAPGAKEGIFSALETKKDKKRRDQYENDFLNWEGNSQTLRLVSRLQVLADFNGLNLTCGTFSAACKYVARSNEIDERRGHEYSKLGFFASEDETFVGVAKQTGTNMARNPITFLVEASDDIVYATGDLEDAVRKDLLDWEMLKAYLSTESDEDELVEETIAAAEEKVHYEPKGIPVPNIELAQAFRTFSIQVMKEECFNTFCKRYTKIMNGQYQKELLKDPECRAAKFVHACKRVGKKHVYPAKETLKLELMGRRVIHDLMDVFWEGARGLGSGSLPAKWDSRFGEKASGLISRNYVEVFNKALEDESLPERYCRLQLVTDQIAGMTDTFATRLHKRLMNG